MDSLQFLPVELVDHIFSRLSRPDLLYLRLVNRHLSALATVFVFSSITTTFTERSLDSLSKISRSKNLACHVKSFEYCFLGTYDTPCSGVTLNLLAMDFTQFKARLSPPGRSYYGHLLGEFHSHYMEQYEAQKRILDSQKDHQILCHSFQRFLNLRSVSIRNAAPEQYPYWQESWTYMLQNVASSGEIAHQNITHAIRARYKPCCRLSLEPADAEDHTQTFTEIKYFSATELPPIFSHSSEKLGFEFNPLDTSLRSGLARITTLNLDFRPPRRSKYQAYQTDPPRPKYWSTGRLAQALASLGSLENLRLCVEEPNGRGARFLENPLQGSWQYLRVAIVSGWEFTEDDMMGFVKRHQLTLRSFFVGYFSLIVQKEDQADDVFFRVWGKLQDMAFECLLEGPFYWGVRNPDSEDQVVERAQIPIDLNDYLAGALRKRKEGLEEFLFARKT